MQQANKVEQGVIVGVREVRISADGSTGAATGAAAGGALGAQAPAGGIAAALGGVGGALVGGLFGQAAEHAVVDTTAYEYIVRTDKGELLSVTQRDGTPLGIGLKVLVITGNQARVVPDYTRPADPPPAMPATDPAAESPVAETLPPVAAPAEVTPSPAEMHPATEPAAAVAPPAQPSVPPTSTDPPVPSSPDPTPPHAVDSSVTGS